MTAVRQASEDPAVVLPLLVQARQMLAETDHQTADQATAAEQREWLHEGGKPGPLLTAQLRRPRGCMGIAAVRTPGGSLLISNPENAFLINDIANVIAVKFFARVSLEAACSVQSQQAAVLEPSITALHLLISQANLLDSPLVSEA